MNYEREQERQYGFEKYRQPERDDLFSEERRRRRQIRSAKFIDMVFDDEDDYLRFVDLEFHELSEDDTRLPRAPVDKARRVRVGLVEELEHRFSSMRPMTDDDIVKLEERIEEKRRTGNPFAGLADRILRGVQRAKELGLEW